MQNLTTLGNFTDKQNSAHSQCADLLFKIGVAIEAAQDVENELKYREEFGKPTGLWDNLSTDYLERAFAVKTEAIQPLMQQYIELCRSVHISIKSFTLSIAA